MIEKFVIEVVGQKVRFNNYYRRTQGGEILDLTFKEDSLDFYGEIVVIKKTILCLRFIVENKLYFQYGREPMDPFYSIEKQLLLDYINTNKIKIIDLD